MTLCGEYFGGRAEASLGPPSATSVSRVTLDYGTIGSLSTERGRVMSSLRGRRDPQTGRVFGFQSETQRQNFMIGRARFCDGPNRQMPRCTAVTRSGERCRAARTRGRPTCFRHGGSPQAKRTRLANAYLSGNSDRIQRAEIRSERSRLCTLWRRDPSEPGRTIVLTPDDEQICRAWASQQGLKIDILDDHFPAFSDAPPMALG